MFKPWLDKYPQNVDSELRKITESSLIELFELSFKQFSSHNAFINMDKRLSYAQLDEKSKAVATYLQQNLKLRQGERVAIMMPNLLQYPIVLLGILRAGLIVVNVNPLYTATELKHQLVDSGATTIFIVSNFAKTLEKIVDTTAIEHVILTKIGDELTLIKRNLVNFIITYVKKRVPKYKLPGALSYRQVLKLGAKGQYIRPVIKQDDIAFIQYTGGTTGISKGAVLTHKNMLASLHQAEAVFASAVTVGQETIVTALPLYHIFALTVNCLYFLKSGGNNILITNPRDIDTFVSTLKKQSFTYFTGLNTLFNALLNHAKFSQIDFSKLKITLAGGMATQACIADKWQSRTGCVVIEGYGLTECAPMVSVNSYDLKKFNGSIGLPMPGTDIRLVNELGELIREINTAGEIEIKGPQVMKEYWFNKNETDNVLINDWFKSGDIGLFDKQGLLYLVDRKKDMILVSGFNVYPNEIEAVVGSIDGVLESAAIGIENEISGEAVKLFIVLKDYSITIEQIQKYCKQHLTAYKRPKVIKVVNSLPKNNVGKVLRRLLRRR